MHLVPRVNNVTEFRFQSLQILAIVSKRVSRQTIRKTFRDVLKILPVKFRRGGLLWIMDAPRSDAQRSVSAQNNNNIPPAEWIVKFKNQVELLSSAGTNRKASVMVPDAGTHRSAPNLLFSSCFFLARGRRGLTSLDPRMEFNAKYVRLAALRTKSNFQHETPKIAAGLNIYLSRFREVI